MKKQNEEIQSRRDFFKKTVKSALPILGAVLLANAPTIVKAAESEIDPMGCGYTCSGTCKNSCEGCRYTCTRTCANSCEGCKYTCSGTCKSSCTGSSR